MFLILVKNSKLTSWTFKPPMQGKCLWHVEVYINITTKPNIPKENSKSLNPKPCPYSKLSSSSSSSFFHHHRVHSQTKEVHQWRASFLWSTRPWRVIKAAGNTSACLLPLLSVTTPLIFILMKLRYSPNLERKEIMKD